MNIPQGCVGNNPDIGCAHSTFSCDSPEGSITFGTTYKGLGGFTMLRALSGPGAVPDSFGNIDPTACASSSSPLSVMSAPGTDEDAAQLCRQLGYTHSSVKPTYDELQFVYGGVFGCPGLFHFIS